MWTTLRVVKGFRTPIIIGREFLEVYHCKLGFGDRAGLSFMQAATKVKVRLRTFKHNQMTKLVEEGKLEDPLNLIATASVSYVEVESMVGMIEVEIKKENRFAHESQGLSLIHI